MQLLTFILVFLAGSAFWAWIVFGDGADRLENTFLSGLFLGSNAPEWSSQGIRVFAAGTWFLQAVWFLVGLFIPAVRLFGP